MSESLSTASPNAVSTCSASSSSPSSTRRRRGRRRSGRGRSAVREAPLRRTRFGRRPRRRSDRRVARQATERARGRRQAGRCRRSPGRSRSRRRAAAAAGRSAPPRAARVPSGQTWMSRGRSSPARSARSASSAPTSAGSFIRIEIKAAAASASGGIAGSLAARSRNAFRRSATVGDARRSFISTTTAAASSCKASSLVMRIERGRGAIEDVDGLRKALRPVERDSPAPWLLWLPRPRSVRPRRHVAGGRANPRARRWPPRCRAQAARAAGQPEAVARRAPGGGTARPTRGRRSALAVEPRRAAVRRPSGPRRLAREQVLGHAFAEPGCSASRRAASRWPCARSASESSE